MHRHFENLYVFAYLVAGICVIVGGISLLSGQSLSRNRGEVISRATEPKRFWAGIVVLGIVALGAIVIGLMGGR